MEKSARSTARSNQETGSYDDATKKAVQDFEKTVGLKSDGKADPVTRDYLKLKNDPNYQRLEGSTKDWTKSALEAHQDDPVYRKEIMELVSSEQFRKLDVGERDLVTSAFADLKHVDETTGDRWKVRMQQLLDLKKDDSYMSLDGSIRN